MAIRFGSGSDGSRNPLTAEEAAMARVLVNAIRNATDKIKVDELARILGRLDADTLDRLLRAISVNGDAPKIEAQYSTSLILVATMQSRLSKTSPLPWHFQHLHQAKL